jgi:hypothetical protein
MVTMEIEAHKTWSVKVFVCSIIVKKLRIKSHRFRYAEGVSV